MEQSNIEPDNEEAWFHSNKKNDYIAEYEEGEGQTG